MSKERDNEESDGADARLKRLVAEGRITPATRPFPTRPPVLVRADRSASEMVLAERREEERNHIEDASFWVDAEVMEARVRARSPTREEAD
jgi:hypothetical protein